MLAHIGLTGGDKKSNTNSFLVCKFSQLGFPLDVNNYFMGFFPMHERLGNTGLKFVQNEYCQYDVNSYVRLFHSLDSDDVGSWF